MLPTESKKAKYQFAAAKSREFWGSSQSFSYGRCGTVLATPLKNGGSNLLRGERLEIASRTGILPVSTNDRQDAGPTDTIQNLDIRRFIQQGLLVARLTLQRYAAIFLSGAKHTLSNYASVHFAMSDTLDNPRIHLVLASGSPRRIELLGQLGVNCILLDHGLDETTVQGESPEAHVRRLAETKAMSALKKAPDIWVLGADTIVVIDEKILGKPRDEQEARDMLASLTGRTHEVFTGYALVRASLPGTARVRQVRSRVHVRNLSPEEIDAYVRTGEPMDKAGAYAIQGIGAAIVEWIQGSYTNVVGLPICELAQDLKELGIFDFLLEHRHT